MKTMLLTSVFAEIETSVVFERPNVAMSAGPLGIPIGSGCLGLATFTSAHAHEGLLLYVHARARRDTSETSLPFTVVSTARKFLAANRAILRNTAQNVSLGAAKES